MQSIYGDKRPALERVLGLVEARVDDLRRQMIDRYGADPVEHCLSRIKTEESMREKCRRKGLPETTESALGVIRDAVGLRIVCAFLDDVYAVRDHLCAAPGFEVVDEKDYIRNVKPNGYRSFHLILRVEGYFVEVQIRTISMDTWAALEHHIYYKKVTGGSASLIEAELKRCADELASTDISMQTIRDLIYSTEGL